MDIAPTSFSAEDLQIIESYKSVTEGLAQYLGPCYEIVLHSLQDLNQSVLAIFNGHFTGRVVGSPVTDLALKMLHDIENSENHSDYICYYTHAKDSQPLKSTTIAIRGTNNHIIGLLCINLYMGSSIATFMDHLVPGSNNTSLNEITENFSEDAESMIESTLKAVQEDVILDTSISSQNKNKEIVQRLYQKGIFQLKNSVSIVASHLGISKNTVYMHIRCMK